MRHNGFLLGQPPAPQTNAIAVAAPFNDIQMIALLAAQLRATSPTVAEAVGSAIEIIAEAVTQAPKLGELIRARQGAMREGQ